MEYIGNIIFDDKLKQANEIVIFGAGYFARKTLDYLKNNHLEQKIVCFCVSNDSKIELCGIPVLLIEEAVERYRNAVYIVTGKYDKEMIQALLDKKIEKIHLIING